MDKKNIVKIYEFIHIVIWIKFLFNNIILSLECSKLSVFTILSTSSVMVFFFFGISEKTKQVKNVF
jgi:hypothetical protein